MAVKQWIGVAEVIPWSFTCGNCGKLVSGNFGFYRNDHGVDALHPHEQSTRVTQRIVICPHCERPTFFDGTRQIPGVAYGKPISNVPPEIASIYRETRDCFAVGAFFPAVLAARTLLMHIAVQLGDKPGKVFAEYVTFLADSGFVPPNGKTWVDQIRKAGNVAAHKIHPITKEIAEQVLKFLEMVLAFQYEYPAIPLEPLPGK